MKTAEEILDEHCIELREEFLTTAKSRKFKQKVLAAMKEYKNRGSKLSEGDAISVMLSAFPKNKDMVICFEPDDLRVFEDLVERYSKT